MINKVLTQRNNQLPGRLSDLASDSTGLVTTTQQVGITVGIPLLGLHTVLAVETTIVLAAAILVALGLRGRRTDAEAVSGAAEAETLDAR